MVFRKFDDFFKFEEFLMDFGGLFRKFDQFFEIMFKLPADG